MKNIIALSLLILCSLTASADKYFTRTGQISFYSDATMEKIEAHNRAMGVLMNTETNNLKFSVLIKSFVFDKKLMQEHFNENYLESDKYPKSKFNGTIKGLSKVNFKKNGKYPVRVSGKLSIHGKTKAISQSGFITIKNGSPTLSSTFKVLLSDYGVKIPSAVKNKISKDVKITLKATLKKM
jgi:polyisoprenoid-binding protein YceI